MTIIMEGCNTFEVRINPGSKYDFSLLQYNNIIDVVLNEIPLNTLYESITITRNVKKYDIDSDEIHNVTIMTLKRENRCYRITAPFALMEHFEMISDKLCQVHLYLLRKEDDLLQIFVKT